MDKLEVGDFVDLINLTDTLIELYNIKDDFDEYNYIDPTVYSKFEKALIFEAISKKIRELL